MHLYIKTVIVIGENEIDMIKINLQYFTIFYNILQYLTGLIE